MKIAEIQVGQTYTYWPPQNAEDNLHFPAEVVEIGKLVKVRIRRNEGECLRSVSARRLTMNGELRLESRGGGGLQTCSKDAMGAFGVTRGVK